jgi:S-adenosylmethionine decarboxylase
MEEDYHLLGRKRKNIDTIIFGKHLTIDAYNCDVNVLANMQALFSFLDTLPEKIGMRKITTPYVIECAGNDKKDCGGISGFVMIAESHISLHTFPEKQYLTMDVYSCTMFDEGPVISIIKDFFKYKKLEKHVIIRGKDFPRENLFSSPLKVKAHQV